MTLIDKKFLNDARINYVSQLLNICLGFVSVTLMVKFAGLGVYGMMATILGLGATVSNLVTFRTNEALVRFYKRGKSKNNYELQYFAVAKGVLLDSITGLILFAIIQIFAETIAIKLLKDADTLEAVLLFSYVVSFSFLRGTGFGLLTARESFFLINVLGVLEQAFKVVLIGVAAWKFRTLHLYILIVIMLITSIPFTIYYFTPVLKQLLQLPGRRWIRKTWIKLYWDFSLSTFISTVLKSGHKNLDVVILGYFSNSSVVGIYSLFKRFISPVEMLSGPYASQIYPKFVDSLNKRDLHPVLKAIQQGSRTLSVNSCIIILLILPMAYGYLKWNGIDLITVDYFSFFLILLASFILQRLWWTRAFSLSTQPQMSVKANVTALIITMSMMPVLVYLLGGLLGAALTTLLNAMALLFFWTRAFKVVYATLYESTKHHISVSQ